MGIPAIDNPEGYPKRDNVLFNAALYTAFKIAVILLIMIDIVLQIRSGITWT
jgi:hypothetical protein